MAPQLSVIIPTYRRPALLDRALRSVFTAGLGDVVEVVVVPNGPDDSWQEVAGRWAHEPRVIWRKLERGHACAARNHGLAEASGRYVRFLDDDDVLLPAALEQLERALAQEADLASAPMSITREDGTDGGVAELPPGEDYLCAALLAIQGCFLAAGTIYRRQAIEGLRWPEDVTLYDDYLWSLAVAARPLRWCRLDRPVARYMQHDAERLSRLRRTPASIACVVEGILALHAQCERQGQLSDARLQAFATALLTHAHSTFPAHPAYLSGVIRRARTLHGHAQPRQAIFRRLPWASHHLLLLEWLTLPLRVLSRSARRASWWFRAWQGAGSGKDHAGH